MKFYRVSFRDEKQEHKGYYFVSSAQEAELIKRQNETPIPDCEGTHVEIEGPFGVPLTKKGVLQALRHYGGHADNG